ncbi:MAG: hypothetical protein ACK4QP_11095 [Pseudorhizobium sp.]
MNRIAFGGHFLSDVLLSIFIVLAISLVAKVILDRMGEWTASAELSSRSARTNLQHEQTSRADAGTLILTLQERLRLNGGKTSLPAPAVLATCIGQCQGTNGLREHDPLEAAPAFHADVARTGSTTTQHLGDWK